MNDITLANGETIEVSINWLTIKILDDYGFMSLQKDMEDSENQLVAASKLIYAILRSNGQKVDEEGALALIPIDDDTIFTLFEIFNKKLEGFKKNRKVRSA